MKKVNGSASSVWILNGWRFWRCLPRLTKVQNAVNHVDQSPHGEDDGEADDGPEDELMAARAVRLACPFPEIGLKDAPDKEEEGERDHHRHEDKVDDVDNAVAVALQVSDIDTALPA